MGCECKIILIVSIAKNRQARKVLLRTGALLLGVLKLMGRMDRESGGVGSGRAIYTKQARGLPRVQTE